MGTSVTAVRGLERRAAPRHALVEEHAILGLRIRPGYDASLLDISASGVLVQCVHRLLPGTSIELQLMTQEQRVPVRGAVVRCVVARLRPSAIWYCGAIAFDRRLSWLPTRPEREYRVRAGDTPQDAFEGAAPSHSPSIVR